MQFNTLTNLLLTYKERNPITSLQSHTKSLGFGQVKLFIILQGSKALGWAGAFVHTVKPKVL